MKIFILFLVQVLLICQVVDKTGCQTAPKFKFEVTAAFIDLTPGEGLVFNGQNFPSYWDLCGINCTRVGRPVQSLSQYCDFDCRAAKNDWKAACYSSCPTTPGIPALYNSNVWPKMATSQLRWGKPFTDAGMSGIGFEPLAGPLPLNTEFQIGTLTHYNFQIIFGTHVKAFTLLLRLIIRDEKNQIKSGPTEFAFPMSCDETRNTLKPKSCGDVCPFDSPKFPGSCEAKCPDQILIREQVNPGTAFVLDDVQYTLALTGFRRSNSRTSLNFFISDEDDYLPARIFASIVPACLPNCPNGQKPVLNPDTLQCACVCDPKPVCAPQQQVGRDCNCECKQDACGAGAHPVTKGDQCPCECDDLKCATPRVAKLSADKKSCSCECPEFKCEGSGKPDPVNCFKCLDCEPCTPKGKNWIPSANCTCICPKKTCPSNFRFNEEKCDCECVEKCPEKCGDGKIDPGEQCDDKIDPCCFNCEEVANGTACSQNKCGVCLKKDGKLTCEDNTATLCPSNECVKGECQVKGSSFNCNYTFFDDAPCGDKDLCLRRCVKGLCTDFDKNVIENRCKKEDLPEYCQTGCCLNQCVPSTGKCELKTLPNATCDDEKECTHNDTCVVTNNATAPITCVGKPLCDIASRGEPNGHPCTQWKCDETKLGACVVVPITNTTVSCPGTSFCSMIGTCSVFGECLNERRDCPTPKDNPCLIRRCNDVKMMCEDIIQLANGLPCDDGDNCTDGDICSDGQCKANGNKCSNETVPTGGFPLGIPLGVTAAVVAAAALVAGFFVFQSIANANIMDPVSWGEIGGSDFQGNPLYTENTVFGDSALYQS